MKSWTRAARYGLALGVVAAAMSSCSRTGLSDFVPSTRPGMGGAGGTGVGGSGGSSASSSSSSSAGAGGAAGAGGGGGSPATSSSSSSAGAGGSCAPVGPPLAVWTRHFGDDSPQAAIGLALDPSGPVIASGWFGGQIDFGCGPFTSVGFEDAFLVKLDASGGVLWAKQFGGPDIQEGSYVAVGANGTVFASGWFNETIDFGGSPLSSAGGADIYLVALTSDGTVTFTKRFGGTFADEPTGLVTDSHGNVVIAGIGDFDFGSGLVWGPFLAKLAPNGDALWSRSLSGSAKSLAIDSSDNLILGGQFKDPIDLGGGLLSGSGFDNIFIVKLDPEGNHLWSVAMSNSSGIEGGPLLAVDASGSVLFTGSASNGIDFGGGPLALPVGDQAPYLAELDAQGKLVFGKIFPSGQDGTGTSIGVTPSGKVAIGVLADTTIDFGAGAANVAGVTGFAIGVFDPAGNYAAEWTPTQASGGIWNLAFDSAERLVAAGDFWGTIQFAGAPVTSASNGDVLVAKFLP